MFRPFPIFLGLRYTRAKRRNHFISFIALLSMLGIAIGVAVLITVLSVMNGFDDVIKTRFFSLAQQVSVMGSNGKLHDYATLQKRLTAYPEITASAPYVSGQGMLSASGTARAVFAYGIDPSQEKDVSTLSAHMVAGSLQNMADHAFQLVIGETLAEQLGVDIGDRVLMITTQPDVSILGMTPRIRAFTIAGIFEMGRGFGFDDKLAFMRLSDAQKLFELGDAVSGLRLKLQDMYQAPRLSQQLQRMLGDDYYVSNWTQQYGSLFSAIQMEKNMMFLILLLIIAVAAFNLVSSLVMMVTEKQSDIAILRTFGATPRSILWIFVVQGSIIGLFGTLLGIGGGMLLASHATAIVDWIQQTFGVQFLSSNIYYVNYLPSRLVLSDVYHVSIFAIVLSLLATLYPAWRASRVHIAEALRYE